MKYVWQIGIILSLALFYKTVSSDYFSNNYQTIYPTEKAQITEIHEIEQNALSDIDTDSALSSVTIAAPIVPYSFVQKQLDDFHFFAIFSEKTAYITSLQFEIFSTHLMKKFRATDLIFPFHFFW